MLGHDNIHLEALAAENRTLRAELDAATARANILRTHLLAAWREHGVLPAAPDAAGVVTGKAALARVCVN